MTHKEERRKGWRERTGRGMLEWNEV
jgi:hypothetical protein